MIDWVAGGVMLTAKALLAEKKVQGWYFSFLGNLILVYLSYTVELYGLMVLGVVNLGFCVRGMYVWGKE